MLEEKIETLTDRLASVETLLKALVSILRKREREAAAEKSEAAPASGEKAKSDTPAVADKKPKTAGTPYTYDDFCVAFKDCRDRLTARYEGQQTAKEAMQRAKAETIAIVRGVAGNVKNGEHIPEEQYGAVIAALRSREDREAA